MDAMENHYLLFLTLSQSKSFYVTWYGLCYGIKIFVPFFITKESATYVHIHQFLNVAFRSNLKFTATSFSTISPKILIISYREISVCSLGLEQIHLINFDIVRNIIDIPSYKNQKCMKGEYATAKNELLMGISTLFL